MLNCRVLTFVEIFENFLLLDLFRLLRKIQNNFGKSSKIFQVEIILTKIFASEINPGIIKNPVSRKAGFERLVKIIIGIPISYRKFQISKYLGIIFLLASPWKRLVFVKVFQTCQIFDEKVKSDNSKKTDKTHRKNKTNRKNKFYERKT